MSVSNELLHEPKSSRKNSERIDKKTSKKIRGPQLGWSEISSQFE